MNLVYNESMASTGVKGSSDTTLSIKAPEDLVRRLDDLARISERKRSTVARMLIIRGLRMFDQDGELRDVPLNQKKQTVPLLKEKAK